MGSSGALGVLPPTPAASPAGIRLLHHRASTPDPDERSVLDEAGGASTVAAGSLGLLSNGLGATSLPHDEFSAKAGSKNMLAGHPGIPCVGRWTG